MKPPIEFNFFWNGPFSNWAHSPFQAALWDDIPRQFATAEQWMMAAKALLFGDLGMLAKILATTDPKKQKALGRAVANFDQEEWDAHARNLVYVGCSHKFEQNPDPKDRLLSTCGILAESSPYDRVWGIGLGASDRRAANPAQWLGTNWLGQVLMHVRKDLRNPAALAPKRRAILDAARHRTRQPDLFCS